MLRLECEVSVIMPMIIQCTVYMYSNFFSALMTTVTHVHFIIIMKALGYDFLWLMLIYYANKGPHACFNALENSGVGLC